MTRFFRSSLAACAALAALPGCNRDGRDAPGASAPAGAPHVIRAAAPAPPAAPAAAGPVQEAEWFALQPRDWEPARTFNEDVERLNDNDPRAVEALARLREAWANAATTAPSPNCCSCPTTAPASTPHRRRPTR
jgi:hypothetical protein